MEKTKSQLRDDVYELALDVIEDENYDIINTGEFLPDDFANAAATIFSNMLKRGQTAWVLKKEPVSIYTLGLQWKIINYPGMISCSDDEKTGVSRSLSCVFGRVYGLDEDDVKELLDMMNEAWYWLNH